MQSIWPKAGCKPTRQAGLAHSAAFTLIELLVTVTVIALLVALIMPALSAARERARRAICIGDERQLAMAVNMFANDNNEALPCYFGGTVVTNGSGNGIHLKVHLNGKWSAPANLGPVKNPNVMLCPSDKTPAQFSMLDENDNPITAATSYAYNYELYMTGTKIGRCNASGIVLLMDGNEANAQSGVWYANINPTKAYKDFIRLNDGAAGDPPVVDRRHNNRFNAVFLDCHVEWLSALTASMLLPDYQ